jgi:ElaB/YqjD/DUF883 family membrane-anchored ribosome-binding protein
MFLNEGFYVNEMSADPMDCMTLYAETVEAFARLDMAQVKAEHDAIMSEDTYMLNEALEEARDKTNQIIADAKAKLLEFIDKVKDKWLQIQSSINAKLLSKNKINAIVRAMENKKDKSFSTTANPKFISSGIVILTYIPSVNKVYAKDQEDPEKAFEEIYENIVGTSNSSTGTFNYEEHRESGTGRYATTKELKNAADFLKSRPQAIKDLTTLRRIVASYKGRAEKEKIKECQKVLSQVVNGINKVTNEAITMLRDAGKAAGTTGKADRKLVDTPDKNGYDGYNVTDADKGYGKGNMKNGIQSNSASILAGYGYYD